MTTRKTLRGQRPTPELAFDVWSSLGDKRSYEAAAAMLANRGFLIEPATLKGWSVRDGWEARHCAAAALKEAKRTPHNPDPLSLESSVLAAEMLNRAAIEGAVRAMKEARKIKVATGDDIAALIRGAGEATKAAMKARDAIYRLAVWREKIERGDLGEGNRPKNAQKDGVNTPYIESNPTTAKARKIDLGAVRRVIGKPPQAPS